jgi:hypothetical protein
VTALNIQCDRYAESTDIAAQVSKIKLNVTNARHLYRHTVL